MEKEVSNVTQKEIGDLGGYLEKQKYLKKKQARTKGICVLIWSSFHERDTHKT